STPDLRGRAGPPQCRSHRGGGAPECPSTQEGNQHYPHCRGTGWRSGRQRSCRQPCAAGGNITGFSILGPALAGKRLELLKEVVPGLSHVTVVSNPTNPHRELEFGWAEKAAQTLPIKLQLLGLHDPNEFEGTFWSRLKSEPGSLSWGTHY